MPAEEGEMWPAEREKTAREKLFIREDFIDERGCRCMSLRSELYGCVV